MPCCALMLDGERTVGEYFNVGNLYNESDSQDYFDSEYYSTSCTVAVMEQKW